MINNFLLHPNYLSGLVHADGSFFFTLSLNTKSFLGIRIRPVFSLTLHENSIDTLYLIQKYFHGIGTIVHNNNKSSVELVVTKRIHLQEYIIPHFIKYPMCGRKQGVLLEFSKILEKLEDKTSLSKSHFIEIIEKIVSLNYTRSVNNLNYLKKKKNENKY